MEKLGKYDIVDKIGVGGFGVVYRAYDPFIKRHVAIKTCSAEDRETRERFAREAEIAGNLQHRHIVTVFEFGFEGEVPYLVQEFLSGEDLDHKIRRGDAISVADKIRWLAEIARGLEFAHSRGVVHRDVKPANIRILDDGSAKILDFGIAKLAQQQSNLTQVGVTLGTASYLAPEQIRGEAVDVRTDIFSFGVLAYELLAYERPFRAQEISATFYKILNDRPGPISARAATVPPELEQIVMRCLEKEPSKRYAPTADLVRALEHLDRRTQTTFRGSDEGRAPSGSGGFAEEKTAALRSSSIGPTSRSPSESPRLLDAAPLPSRPAPSPPLSPTQRTTVGLGEMVLETPKSGARPESYALRSARLRGGSRWPRWLGGILAALVVVAAAAVLIGPRIPGFEPALKAVLAGQSEGASPPVAAPGPAVQKVSRPSPAAASASKRSEPAPSVKPRTESVAGPQVGPSAASAEATSPPPAPTPPIVQPPKPAVLIIGPAWDAAMTVRVGGTRYRLDREQRIELPAGSIRLDFALQTPSYVFEEGLRLKLAAGATERVSIPIEKPGRLTVQPHLNTRPGSVRIDGQMAGAAPLRGRWLAPGDHFIEIFTVAGGGVTPVVTQSLKIQSDVETILSFDVDGHVPPEVREKPLTPP